MGFIAGRDGGKRGGLNIFVFRGEGVMLRYRVVDFF